MRQKLLSRSLILDLALAAAAILIVALIKRIWCP